MLSAKEIYQRLLNHYGAPRWWSDDSYKIMFEAVLVQQTQWSSVEKVSNSLGSKLNPYYISSLSLDELISIIKPCGFSKAKAKTIISLTSWYSKYGFDRNIVSALDKEDLKKELLAIKGIGEESADVLLVFAFQKCSFIIDAYTRRFLLRLGYYFKNDGGIRKFFEDDLENDYKTYGYFHWLILDHSIKTCKKIPACKNCPFSECKERFV